MRWARDAWTRDGTCPLSPHCPFSRRGRGLHRRSWALPGQSGSWFPGDISYSSPAGLKKLVLFSFPEFTLTQKAPKGQKMVWAT